MYAGDMYIDPPRSKGIPFERKLVEKATFIDVDKIVIDTSVTTGLVYEVMDDRTEPAACSVTHACHLDDIIQGPEDPLTQ